jgi:hemerythrin-like domain-containing protein
VPADLLVRGGAPSATRTRGLLLRRHFPNVACHRPVPPDIGSGRSENRWTSPVPAGVRRSRAAGPRGTDAVTGRVTFLADHIDLVLRGLHSHHQDEDELLYPKLIERAPEQAPMTEHVEHEHQVIATALDAASGACATWRQQPSAQTGEALAAALGHLNEVVQPHLDDEEQKVVPLAAVTLTQQEWDGMGKRGMSPVPRNKRAIAAGMMLEPLDADDRAFMMKHVPAPLRMFFPFMIERPWKKYEATLRTGT